ncbi:MAG: S8 family serine peptidase [Bacteroidota bacterium]
MQFLKLIFLLLPIYVRCQQLGFALEQINARSIIEEGLSGSGVKIGIIDGGFLGAPDSPSLKKIFEKKLIAGYKDYLDSSAAPYSGSKALDDGHGTEVWRLLAGFNDERNIQYGLATGAIYYLARTDHGAYEKRTEEENAVKAMEWMATEGVQIINLSLGYNYGYRNKTENYTKEQMDGKSTLLTKAINRLSESHDILFVVAAGNDGGTKWKIIGSPADAASALTVGATKFSIWDKVRYSSLGPVHLDYVKPEIACYASAGTSFSTPIISGLAACLLEANPRLSSTDLKTIITQSGNLPYPNNYLGYGVPDASVALELSKSGVSEASDEERLPVRKKITVNTGGRSGYLQLYHKEGWKVLKQERIFPKRSNTKIKRPNSGSSTTVIRKGEVIEIEWIN